MRTAVVVAAVTIVLAAGIGAVTFAIAGHLSSGTELKGDHAAGGQASPAPLEPVPVALAAVGPSPSTSRSVRVVSRDGSQAVVEVVDDKLADDSVAAVRHTVALRLEAGTWRVTGNTVSYRCQAARGSPLAPLDGGWQKELCL